MFTVLVDQKFNELFEKNNFMNLSTNSDLNTEVIYHSIDKIKNYNFSTCIEKSDLIILEKINYTKLINMINVCPFQKKFINKIIGLEIVQTEESSDINKITDIFIDKIIYCKFNNEERKKLIDSKFQEFYAQKLNQVQLENEIKKMISNAKIQKELKKLDFESYEKNYINNKKIITFYESQMSNQICDTKDIEYFKKRINEIQIDEVEYLQKKEKYTELISQLKK